jgi:hypothetical protein
VIKSSECFYGMTSKLASNTAVARYLNPKDDLEFATDWLGCGEADGETEPPVGGDPAVAVVSAACVEEARLEFSVFTMLDAVKYPVFPMLSD